MNEKERTQSDSGAPRLTEKVSSDGTVFRHRHRFPPDLMKHAKARVLARDPHKPVVLRRPGPQGRALVTGYDGGNGPQYLNQSDTCSVSSGKLWWPCPEAVCRISLADNQGRLDGRNYFIFELPPGVTEVRIAVKRNGKTLIFRYTVRNGLLQSAD